METTQQETITENGRADGAAPFDLAEARAKVAALRAEVEAQEIAIAEEELCQAEAAHSKLYEKCVAAQNVFDESDRKVEAQTRVVFQASTRKAGAASQLDMHRRNVPGKTEGNVRYGDTSIAQWNADLEKFLQEQRQAESEHAAAFGSLSILQGERRAATKVLEDSSWEESRARNRVAELRRKLDAMTPRPAKTEWGENQTPILNGKTLELSSDNSLRSDLVSRRAATRGPADSVLSPR